MNNWFEVKVSHEKTLENGMQKKVTEHYLVDALSHAEAEARDIEEMKPYVTGELTISSVRRTKISEMFFNEYGDKWYKAKLNFVTLDEKSGTEKKTPAPVLAQASDIKEALSVVEEGMKGTMADYSIVSLTETPIMEVFPFIASEVTI